MEQKSVFIVEDDAVVAIHLRNMLTALGYNVTGPVATGEAAIAAVAVKAPDLILMDIQLAEKIDGIAAARCILSSADIPIVFLTSYAQDTLIQQAKTTLPYGYLLKPVSQRELAVSVEMALYRHRLDLQLKAHEAALCKANDELEQRVQERTADLLSINDKLCREIEERRRAEESLVGSEERYRRITEGLTNYLYTVRVRDGKAVEIIHNPASEIVTGYTPQEYAGDQDLWKQIVVEEDRARVSGHIGRILTGEKVPPIEHRITHKDGQIRWVSNTLIPQFDSGGMLTAYDGVIKDITERKLMDRQLIQSEKLASLGLLIAGIAHEINNPNNFIYFNTPILRSYVQFLLPIVDEYIAAHPEVQAFGRPYPAFREDCFRLLDNIEHGSTRINQIVGNLREFVRDRGKGERRRIDLRQVVEKGVSICLGRIRKTVKTFEVRFPEELQDLVTDPLAVEQIVVNLLVNAAQAVDKEDSSVTLAITSREAEGEVIIEVVDNGCGMDAETQKKIFDPFFTTKAAGIGTGLGLSISHRLVTELGGRIEVHSEVGKGSRFRVALRAASTQPIEKEGK